MSPFLSPPLGVDTQENGEMAVELSDLSTVATLECIERDADVPLWNSGSRWT